MDPKQDANSGCCSNKNQDSEPCGNPVGTIAGACCGEKPASKNPPTSCCDDGGCGEEVVVESVCDKSMDCCNEQSSVSDPPTGCCGAGDCGEASVAEPVCGKSIDCCIDDKDHCDEKCIEVAAAIECEIACDNGDDDAHKHDHDAEGKHNGGACSDHLRRAFEQYTSYLESARCVCRSVLERTMAPTCCDKQSTNGPTKNKSKKAKVEPEALGLSTSHVFHKHAHAGHATKRRGVKHRHRFTNGGESSGSSVLSQELHVTTQHDNINKVPSDLEKGAALDHIAMVVDGMTCSGCGKKLETALQAMAGVTNVQVNFVMGRAEFTLDSSCAKPEEVVHAAERATGFRCVRRVGGHQTLDIIASPASAKVISGLGISGLMDVTTLDKKTVSVTYDPAFTGARTLLAAIGSLSEGLAPLRSDATLASGRKKMYDQLIKTTLAAIFTIPVLVLAWGEHLADTKTRAYVSIVLATLVQCIAIPDFYIPALSALIRNGDLEMDMLIVISITAAYVYSIIAFSFRMAGKPLQTGEFFETSTLLITLVLLGRLVATFARIRAVAAVSLRSLQPATAVLVESGLEREIDCRLLQFEDKFKVMPHTRIPTDGVILEGTSDIDESMLTGESMPVTKTPDMAVIAGTINNSGTLLVRLTRLPGKNTVTDIAELVEEASKSKPRVQDLADKVASYFVPVISAVAIAVTIIWIVVGIKVRNNATGDAIVNAITFAVAVLAVSCPCAIGLAVPMVLVIAGGIAARGGVIIKSAQCTERARIVTDVVFDKTGTLTEGDLDVFVDEILDTDHNETLAITKALVQDNNHPVSAAVAKHLESRHTTEIALEDARVVPGSGVTAIYNGSIIKAGNPTWTQCESEPSVMRALADGMTILCVTRGKALIAMYGLKASLRTEAASTVRSLQDRNLNVHLVSGDQPRAVEAVANAVGIMPSNVVSRQTPTQKREYVESLMARGKVVLFCGDGTNDAVAVAQADIGVQLGDALSSSDVTRAAADVVLLAGLRGIPFLLEVSRAAYRRMMFNFAWSGIYNVLAILLATGAFVNFRIPPAYAGLGEIVSVLPVILVAMTMLLLKYDVSQ